MTPYEKLRYKFWMLFPFVREQEAMIGRMARQHGDYVAGKCTIEEIALENGNLSLAIGTDLARYMAEVFGKSLEEHGAENYLEMQFTRRGEDPAKRRIAVTVKWETGKTPHEMRAQAEAIIHHAYIHEGYRDLGFEQMTTAQKVYIYKLLRKWNFIEHAKRLEELIDSNSAERVDPEWKTLCKTQHQE